MVGPFQRFESWRELGAAFLDEHAEALSFFSEAGFRFFLPAYLIADLRAELERADPVHYRLSIFTREESSAIVAYLETVREREEFRAETIDTALASFWRRRASTAPTAADLDRHEAMLARFLAAAQRDVADD